MSAKSKNKKIEKNLDIFGTEIVEIVEEVLEKEKKSSPFEFINSINFTKDNLMENSLNDEMVEKTYSPYITNRTLSYFPDTIEQANLMNMNSHIDSKLQYIYLLSTIRKRKRFSKWIKPENDNHLANVMFYYNVNRKKALDFLKILDTEQLKRIEELITNGTKN